MTEHRAVLKRVGLVLVAVGLADVAVMIYCIATRQSYSSSINVFAVAAGVFLIRGSLAAAHWVACFSAEVFSDPYRLGEWCAAGFPLTGETVLVRTLGGDSRWSPAGLHQTARSFSTSMLSMSSRTCMHPICPQTESTSVFLHCARRLASEGFRRWRGRRGGYAGLADRKQPFTFGE